MTRRAGASIGAREGLIKGGQVVRKHIEIGASDKGSLPVDLRFAVIEHDDLYFLGDGILTPRKRLSHEDAKGIAQLSVFLPQRQAGGSTLLDRRERVPCLRGTPPAVGGRMGPHLRYFSALSSSHKSRVHPQSL